MAMVLVPLGIAVLVLTSWAARPEDRRLTGVGQVS
jgi:hypothetical protein